MISASDEVTVKESSILHLKLNRPVVETEGEDDPLAKLPIFGGGKEYIGVIQLKEAISNAAKDENIRGIYLDVPYLMSDV